MGMLALALQDDCDTLPRNGSFCLPIMDYERRLEAAATCINPGQDAAVGSTTQL
jgi:hypothetical protein